MQWFKLSQTQPVDLTKINDHLMSRGWKAWLVLEPNSEPEDPVYIYDGYFAEYLKDNWSYLNPLESSPEEYDEELSNYFNDTLEWYAGHPDKTPGDWEVLVPDDLLMGEGGIDVLFGYTEDISLAGYAQADGRMIDFSGGQGSRALDHRDINKVFDGSPGTAGMQEFMSQGNIRLLPGSGFDIMGAPTEPQYRRLAEFIRMENGEVAVDLQKGLGKREREEVGEYYFKHPSNQHLEYGIGTNPAYIINDIRDFFA